MDEIKHRLTLPKQRNKNYQNSTKIIAKHLKYSLEYNTKICKGSMVPCMCSVVTVGFCVR